MNLEAAPDVLTVQEAAELLRVGRNAAYQLVRSGRLYGAHFGHSIRIPKTSLVAFLEGQAVAAGRPDLKVAL